MTAVIYTFTFLYLQDFHFKPLSLRWVCAHLDDLKEKMKWNLQGEAGSPRCHTFVSLISSAEDPGALCEAFSRLPSAGWKPDEVQMWSRWGPFLRHGPKRTRRLWRPIKLKGSALIDFRHTHSWFSAFELLIKVRCLVVQPIYTK